VEPRPEKILSITELSERIAQMQKDNKRVVMCHGVFDLMHIGHIRHFEQARKLGDAFIVTLTPDQYVNKGTHRPAFPEILRTEAVAALSVVDYVALNEWPTAENTIQILRPDIFCKGGEYRQKQVDSDSTLQPEIAAVKAVGAELEFTDDVVFSSSQLLNQHFSPFPPETDEWLEGFRRRYSAEEIVGQLDNLKDKKVLVVGEAIIDEYVFTDAIGKSTKDPVLACQFQSQDAFAGGSLAIANHLAGFCDHVGLVTCLGDTERREDFIRESLLPNIHPSFITKHGSPTIHKRRFVDQYSQNKLLELYVMNDRPLAENDERALHNTLDSQLENYDVVIAADYGHGLLTSPIIELLCEKAPFLAVNTQSNAGNRGFNPVSKYKKADYVCLATHEIELETRMREAKLTDLLVEVTQRIQCDHFTVTNGKFGSLHYNTTDDITRVPAFAGTVTDRVGAGDAVLALTSLLVHQGLPWDLIGFVGNLSGAQIVAELGNRVPVDKIPLAKHIISLLK
jgi:rfaE bifunctional protein kinase chain/domain/rfaE bifunctional protein nucleotidyltransferase chain/domain